MLEMPRRSVTRFFIPLIDVLTLLFCIFLLMPMVKGTGETSPDAFAQPPGREVVKPPPPRTPAEQEREELEHLRAERMETLQKRLAIRVLEIDADTGKLYSYDPQGGQTEVTSEADASALIRRHRQELADRQRRDGQVRELYYLFLFPRKLTGYPEERQVKAYERWFAGVAHGVDNPRGEP